MAQEAEFADYNAALAGLRRDLDKVLARFSMILCLLVCVILTSASAQSTETELVRDAAILDHAVIPVTDWGEHFPNDAKGVVGSAFFVNQDGYFVTAAHVLEGYKPKSGKLSAIIRQRDGSGAGQWFDLIEKDDKHDLALCKIAAPFELLRKANQTIAEDMKIVIPNSLQLAPQRKPVIGRFVVIAGFPLGSWNPTVQLGHIAATHILNPNLPMGSGHLMQISVAGNQGDSGAPVVDLHTGQVIGVIVRGSFSLHLENGAITVQSSGILLAEPVQSVNELLMRNHVKNAACSLLLSNRIPGNGTLLSHSGMLGSHCYCWR